MARARSPAARTESRVADHTVDVVLDPTSDAACGARPTLADLYTSPENRKVDGSIPLATSSDAMKERGLRSP